MVRFTAIAGVHGYPVIVEALETSPAVEAVSVSALGSWYLTIVAEPAFGAGAILVVPIVFLPKVLVPGVLEIPDA
jgi:hypothetical protein